MLYVGLDYHLRTSDLCILNEDGKVVKRQTIKGRFSEVAEELAKAPGGPLEVVFEATGGYGPLYEKLIQVARRVVMAHPASLRLIWGSKRKNDRIDAHKLAKLLYLDAVPHAHVPCAATRQWRRLIELRRSLVRRRAALKNQVHALLRTCGIAAPASLFSGKGLNWLMQQPLDDEASMLERAVLIEQMHGVRDQLKTVEKALAKNSDGDPRVTLLMTIPGVGKRTAEAFVAYVDRIERFGRSGQVGSYFGLVPCEDSSAGKARLGHITKQGPPGMRQLLVEAAWMGVRKSPTLRRRFEQLCGDDRDRRKIAIVAMARHLSQVMAAMLRDGQPWRETTAAA